MRSPRFLSFLHLPSPPSGNDHSGLVGQLARRPGLSDPNITQAYKEKISAHSAEDSKWPQKKTQRSKEDTKNKMQRVGGALWVMWNINHIEQEVKNERCDSFVPIHVENAPSSLWYTVTKLDEDEKVTLTCQISQEIFAHIQRLQVIMHPKVRHRVQVIVRHVQRHQELQRIQRSEGQNVISRQAHIA